MVVIRSDMNIQELNRQPVAHTVRQREEQGEPTVPGEQIVVRAAKDVELAVSYLNIRLYGQKITNSYRLECATLLTQEMDLQGIRDLTRLNTIIPEAVEIHIARKINEPRWTYEQIQAVNRYNKEIQGIVERRNPYFFWRTDRIQFSDRLNSEPWQLDNSFRLSHVPAALAIGAGTIIGGIMLYKAVKYFTSGPSVTLSTGKLPLQPFWDWPFWKEFL